MLQSRRSDTRPKTIRALALSRSLDVFKDFKAARFPVKALIRGARAPQREPGKLAAAAAAVERLDIVSG